MKIKCIMKYCIFIVILGAFATSCTLLTPDPTPDPDKEEYDFGLYSRDAFIVSCLEVGAGYIRISGNQGMCKSLEDGRIYLVWEFYPFEEGDEPVFTPDSDWSSDFWKFDPDSL